MILSDQHEIRVALQQLRNLAECILMDICVSHFGTEWTLRFNYVWNEIGTIRDNLDKESLVELRFSVVQEFKLVNALTESMYENVGEINWGISEVADVQICDTNSVLHQYQNANVPFHHVICQWENERRIDIVFSTMTVLRPD